MIDAQRRRRARIAGLAMDAKFRLPHWQPGLRRAGQHRHRISRRAMLDPAGFGAEELVTAAGTGRGRQHVELLAVRAGLGEYVAGGSRGTAVDIDGVDRPVAADVTGEVEDQAVSLARRLAGATADLLDQQPWRTGRAQQCDQIDFRDIEADREHVDAGQATDLAGAKRRENRIALIARSFGDYRLTSDAMPAERVAHGIGVIDAGAERQPGTPVSALLDDLGNRAFDHIGNIGGALELAGNEFAAAAADAGHIDPGRCGLRRQLSEVAVLDALLDAVGKNRALEQRAVAAIEIAAIEPEAGGRGTDHAQIRRAPAQRVDQAEIHAVAVTRDQLHLIDQQQITLAEQMRVVK